MILVGILGVRVLVRLVIFMLGILGIKILFLCIFFKFLSIKEISLFKVI